MPAILPGVMNTSPWWSGNAQLNQRNQMLMGMRPSPYVIGHGQPSAAMRGAMAQRGSGNPFLDALLGQLAPGTLGAGATGKAPMSTVNPQDPLQLLMKQFQEKFDEANAANLQRYSEILGGYDKRYGKGMELADVARDQQYRHEIAQVNQDLVRRGLRASTLAGTGAHNAFERAQQIPLNVHAQLSGDKLAFMERRTDEAPSLDTIAQLAMASGQNQLQSQGMLAQLAMIQQMMGAGGGGPGAGFGAGTQPGGNFKPPPGVTEVAPGVYQQNLGLMAPQYNTHYTNPIGAPTYEQFGGPDIRNYRFAPFQQHMMQQRMAQAPFWAAMQSGSPMALLAAAMFGGEVDPRILRAMFGGGVQIGNEAEAAAGRAEHGPQGQPLPGQKLTRAQEKAIQDKADMERFRAGFKQGLPGMAGPLGMATAGALNMLDLPAGGFIPGPGGAAIGAATPLALLQMMGERAFQSPGQSNVNNHPFRRHTSLEDLAQALGSDLERREGRREYAANMPWWRQAPNQQTQAMMTGIGQAAEQWRTAARGLGPVPTIGRALNELGINRFNPFIQNRNVSPEQSIKDIGLDPQEIQQKKPAGMSSNQWQMLVRSRLAKVRHNTSNQLTPEDIAAVMGSGDSNAAWQEFMSDDFWRWMAGGGSNVYRDISELLNQYASTMGTTPVNNPMGQWSMLLSPQFEAWVRGQSRGLTGPSDEVKRQLDRLFRQIKAMR